MTDIIFFNSDGYKDSAWDKSIGGFTLHGTNATTDAIPYNEQINRTKYGTLEINGFLQLIAITI